METISNMMPKANHEYLNYIYDINEDVCNEYKEIAKFTAEKIEEIEAEDDTLERMDFFLPCELLAKTKFSEIHIYCYKEYFDIKRVSNYMLFIDEEGLSLSIDLYKLYEWLDGSDMEDSVIDELMNVERDYGLYKEGKLEEEFERMAKVMEMLRESSKD
ncbi:MAG: hypothetical protein IKV19_00800 [Bacteroidaceae bacterium]|nr:hypothetical protein [Bacteroidaceae bacterium]